MSSNSAISRKYGLNLLQSPLLLNSDNYRNEDEALFAMNASLVETFLDDNPDFLESYVQRKVPRSKLENWLFRPGGKKKEVFPTTQSGGNYASEIRRQRSRSFTPLRKLSASTFEDCGLSTPILVKDVDGQPTFLRTSPKVSQSPQLKDRCFMLKKQTVKHIDRNQSLYLTLEEFLKEKEGSKIFNKLAEGLKSLLHANHVSILLTDSIHAFSGDLYILDDEGVYTKTKSFSADRLMTGVMTSRQTLNIPKPEIFMVGGPISTKASIIGPLIDMSSQRVKGALRVAVTDKASSSSCQKDQFSKEDEIIFNVILRFASIALTSALERKELHLELARSEVFLELAQTVFREQNRIEPTIRTILANFLTVIECQRCQILLTEQDESVAFKRVFGLERSDLNDEGEIREGVSLDDRFPIHAAITGEAAVKKKKINIPNLKMDERFSPTIDCDAGLEHHSLLCLPIIDGQDRVLGVISLINKSQGGHFTENDERFAEAFALFCGMALRNAAEIEHTVVSEAKLQVAFDTINYQASASEEEAKELAKETISSAVNLKLERLEFSYIGLSDCETHKATIRMFTDLGLLSHFNIKYPTFCRWILTVQKNYRNDTVPYHNWYHAFNVTQMMFAIIKNAEWDKVFLSKVECLSLLLASLCHDLDHRGTTNAFQLKSKNPLATLYSSSTLERHHLNQCLLLLNIPGNRILENLSEDEYSSTLSMLERCILATDLGLHFRHAAAIERTAHSGKPLMAFSELDRHNLHSLLMTTCDLGAISKPWPVHRHVTALVAEEFWMQGDVEREVFRDEPLPPMMDRRASLALVQIEFIENVAEKVFDWLSLISPDLRPMYERAVENKEKWRNLETMEEEEEENGEEEDREEVRARTAAVPARNL